MTGNRATWLGVKGLPSPLKHRVGLVFERVGLVALFALQLVATLPPVSGAARPTGPRASGSVAITPDGSLVFVVNPDSGSVSSVDTRIDEKVGETRVGEDPRALALGPGGHHLYVTSQRSSTLTVLDATKLTPLTTIEVGAEPYGVVVDPGGQLVYVASSATGSIAVVEIRPRYSRFGCRGNGRVLRPRVRIGVWAALFVASEAGLLGRHRTSPAPQNPPASFTWLESSLGRSPRW